MLREKDMCLNEDCFMQIRSIFENHVMSRYVREHINIDNETTKVVQDFLVNPLSVYYNYYMLAGQKILNEKGENVGKIKMPSALYMGDDKKYSSELYSFLCQYTHCSFSALTCYFEKGLFNLYKQNFTLTTLLLAIFCFEKIYEGVVTVRGEDFDTKAEEKSYYDLAYDTLEIEFQVLEYLITYYKNKTRDLEDFVIGRYIGEDDYDDMSNKMIRMFEVMKESLLDQDIGSLNKKKFENGKFYRTPYMV